MSEQQRLHLFTTLEQGLGDEDAATMMELVPPAGWADLATKQDLEHLRTAVNADLVALEARLQRSFATWLFAAMGIQTAVVGLLTSLG